MDWTWVMFNFYQDPGMAQFWDKWKFFKNSGETAKIERLLYKNSSKRILYNISYIVCDLIFHILNKKWALENGADSLDLILTVLRKDIILCILTQVALYIAVVLSMGYDVGSLSTFIVCFCLTTAFLAGLYLQPLPER